VSLNVLGGECAGKLYVIQLAQRILANVSIISQGEEKFSGFSYSCSASTCRKILP